MFHVIRQCRSRCSTISRLGYGATGSKLVRNIPRIRLNVIEGLRFRSTVAADEYLHDTNEEIRRLTHLRNVGVFAHVDAGKTTVTERMLALAGVVRRAGTVDDGNTVTDFLPAERERGITIQSAAISFEWGWHNNRTGDDYNANDNVQIHLIDTPGHVDFSVEVNRSVAVLDGAVLVVDAVAGVQAQTETVWRAMTRPSMNNHEATKATSATNQDHGHEPLPCLALINKMDKDGCNYGNAISSLRHKLPGANPIAIQVPLFRGGAKTGTGSKLIDNNVVAIPVEDMASVSGEFVGVVDLIHMRAIVWPETTLTKGGVANVEECIPKVVPLLHDSTHEPLDSECHVTRAALNSREEFVAALADVDDAIEDYFLLGEEPSNAELRAALRRATLDRKALPVMAGAALRGKGIEPVLDAVADLLPSPLDRTPPALTYNDDNECDTDNKTTEAEAKSLDIDGAAATREVTVGHPLHPSLLALAFKVVHMKGRGGSGDGRVVFARVYSGQLGAAEKVQVVTPPAPGETAQKPRTERIGGMLELAGGRFNNVEDGICQSGDVCALVGLKSVVTGDTIVIRPEGSGRRDRKRKIGRDKKKDNVKDYYLAGVASPKPVLKVRLEAETDEEQSRLSEALQLLEIEDPSLFVEETESATLLSGLGELHIEVTLDRLHREFGLQVRAASPSVAYRETITEVIETPNGELLEFDRTIGGTRMQASVHLVLEPLRCTNEEMSESSCTVLTDPVVSVGLRARDFLGVDQDMSEDDLIHQSEVFKALVLGCKGALKRGPLGAYAMANVRCNVVDLHAEGGISSLREMPGSLRAAAAHVVSATMDGNRDFCTVLEPSMSVEVTMPGEMVGTVLSDLTGRRGSVGDVVVGNEDDVMQSLHSKALVRGEVPLAEILGYANALRSLTAGEGAFTAEYKGHSPCDQSFLRH